MKVVAAWCHPGNAREVGRTVRKTMIELSGATPESLPLAEHVRDVRKKIKGATKNFRALDGSKKRPSEE